MNNNKSAEKFTSAVGYSNNGERNSSIQQVDSQASDEWFQA